MNIFLQKAVCGVRNPVLYGVIRSIQPSTPQFAKKVQILISTHYIYYI